MKIEPIKKDLYNKLKEQGVEKLTLSFSGGDDEGYLDIDIDPAEKAERDIYNEIEDWAWSVYSYSGAGDGNAYGDNIIYDIKNGKASTEEWFTKHEYGESEEMEIEVDDEEDDK